MMPGHDFELQAESCPNFFAGRNAEDLHAYVRRAHELGLKVMMDLVYLHCGPKAPMRYENPDCCEWTEEGKPVVGDWPFLSQI